MAVSGIGQSRGTQGVQKCNTCGSMDKNLLQRCGQCRSAMYCGAACQKADWPSHKIVCKQIANIETVFSSGAASQITPTQKIELLQLINLPLNSILDGKETEQMVKDLGQKWFDQYKDQAGGRTLGGRTAVIDMCEWIAYNTKDTPRDARLRKEYVARAWGEICSKGIGDDSWRWIA